MKAFIGFLVITIVQNQCFFFSRIWLRIFFSSSNVIDIDNAIFDYRFSTKPNKVRLLLDRISRSFLPCHFFKYVLRDVIQTVGLFALAQCFNGASTNLKSIVMN